MTMNTLFWHDYETWGARPAIDRPSQFAGIRTDENLNIVGEPLCIYCKPCPDVLPQPVACLITGITPQKAYAEGFSEAEFIKRIYHEMSQPNTCCVGFNSVRFDDEVTRFTLYRNFYDPYEREWKNGNTRWDIIDMVRLTYALRPEGIVWPRRADEPDLPSFKLELLTQANGISHEAAHDAMSDVYATIAVAKLIKDKQPELYQFVYNNRKKEEVARLLNWRDKKPVLHVSSMFSARQGCLAIVMPVAIDPTNKNNVICINLCEPVDDIINMGAGQLRDLLYTKSDDLPEGQARIPLLTIAINKCPVVATTKLLDESAQQRLSIDMAGCVKNWQQLMAFADLENKLTAVYDGPRPEPHADPEQALYGGFIGNQDKPTMQEVRRASAADLAAMSYTFYDKRLQEMLWRYKARNFPESLSQQECELWDEFRYKRITEGVYAGDLTMEQYQEIIEQLWMDAEDKDKLVLEALAQYGDELLF